MSAAHDFGEVGRSLWNVDYHYKPKGNDLPSELEQFIPGHRRGRWSHREQPPPTRQRSPGRRGFSRQIRRINRRIPTELKVEYFLSHVEKNMRENLGFGFTQPSEVFGDTPGAVDHTKWNPFQSVNLSPTNLAAAGGQSEDFKFVGAPKAFGSKSISSCIYGAVGDHLREKGSCYGKLGDILNLHSSPDPSTGISSSGSCNLDPALAMLRASQESWYQFAPWVSGECWVFTESVRSTDELQL